MKKRYFLSILLLIFLFARECSPFEISYYKSRSTSNSTANSNSTSSSYSKFGSFSGSDIINIYDEGMPHVVISGLKYLQNDSSNGNENTIYVHVSKTTTISNNRYVPLIKLIDFRSSISYNWSCKFEKDNTITDSSYSGIIKIQGKNKIYGICSARKATELITITIEKEIKEKILKEINDVLLETR